MDRMPVRAGAAPGQAVSVKTAEGRAHPSEMIRTSEALKSTIKTGGK
jgi:hypothetical protein